MSLGGLLANWLDRLSRIAFEVIRGLPRDLYREGVELDRQARAVEMGLVTDEEAIEAIRERHRQLIRKLYEYWELGRVSRS